MEATRIFDQAGRHIRSQNVVYVHTHYSDYILHSTLLITDGDTLKQVSPMALVVTTPFVCSEPEDELASDSDHRSTFPLFFSQAPSWHHSVLVSRLSFRLTCHVSFSSSHYRIVSSEGILLRTS